MLYKGYRGTWFPKIVSLSFLRGGPRQDPSVPGGGFVRNLPKEYLAVHACCKGLGSAVCGGCKHYFNLGGISTQP